MSKYLLQSKMKSTGTAYLCWFMLGCHYAYLNKWGLQVLYWVTIGGLGIWILIDLFTMGSKVEKHNRKIAMQIEEIEELQHQRNLEKISAISRT